MSIENLIEKNERDISLFREYIAKLTDHPSARRYIGDLQRRIGDSTRANAILRRYVK